MTTFTIELVNTNIYIAEFAIEAWTGDSLSSGSVSFDHTIFFTNGISDYTVNQNAPGSLYTNYKPISATLDDVYDISSQLNGISSTYLQPADFTPGYIAFICHVASIDPTLGVSNLNGSNITSTNLYIKGAVGATTGVSTSYISTSGPSSLTTTSPSGTGYIFDDTPTDGDTVGAVIAFVLPAGSAAALLLGSSITLTLNAVTSD